MWGLGLNFGEFNSSAVAVKDGRVICGAPEERFTRQKKTKDFPNNSIDFILAELGFKIQDFDYIATGWNPGCYWEKWNPLISRNRIRREDNLFVTGDQLSRRLDASARKSAYTYVKPSNELPSVYHVKHHLAHAANAYYLSPFKDAAIVSLDWTGEFESTFIGHGVGHKITEIETVRMPHSLGMFYATFTELLGYKSDSDEWKVMALAAFGSTDDRFYDAIRKMVTLKPEGTFELNQRYFKGDILTHGELYTDEMIATIGSFPDDDVWCKNVAWAMQKVSEEIGLHLVKHAKRATGSQSVVLSGGFAMNTVFTSRVSEVFDKVYVPYAPSDLGNSIGAALYVGCKVMGSEVEPKFNSSSIGPEYDDESIQSEITRRGLTKYSQTGISIQQIADILMAQHPIGFFVGKMEFGERALGNRSILASPRDARMKDTINSCVKHREGFRPFAPVVLAEEAHRYFDVPEGYQSPYMEKVVQVKSEHRAKLAAVTHVDGSARLQTVTPSQNPSLHQLLHELKNRGEVPVLLNTSFNTSSEPMVCSPADALCTFYSTSLNYLVLGNTLVRKQG